MKVRFEGASIQNGTENINYSNEVSVNYPTTDAQNAPHNGSAHGNWVLSEKNLLVKYPFSNTTGFKSTISITDGRTRHRWVNRGDPLNDPMAPTFGCPN